MFRKYAYTNAFFKTKLQKEDQSFSIYIYMVGLVSFLRWQI